MSTYSVDPGHIKTLIKSFWNKGWRLANKSDVGLPSKEQTKAATENGLLFNEAEKTSHDKLVSHIIKLKNDIDEEDVANAFISSMTSRRLDLRSALSSYLVAKNLPQHSFAGNSYACEICGLSKGNFEYDLNMLSFERFKWGGVRKDDLTYVAFDLEQFKKAPLLEANMEDKKLFKQVLETLINLPANTTATQAVKSLSAIKGNKSERELLMDSLGIAGVLETAKHKGYNSVFVPFSERVLPNKHFVDRRYPVCWWTAADGVNEANVKVLFRQLGTLKRYAK